jgi:hypothetical protein
MSNTFTNRIVTAWKRSPVTRLRLGVAGIMLVISTLNIALLFNNTPVLRNLSGVMGLILAASMFGGPMLYWLARIRHVRHQKLPVQNVSIIADALTDEGRWYMYRFKPNMAEWIASNCLGRVGVMPYHARDQYRPPDTAMLWFARPSDALAFKMRWHGLTTEQMADALR